MRSRALACLLLTAPLPAVAQVDDTTDDREGAFARGELSPITRDLDELDGRTSVDAFDGYFDFKSDLYDSSGLTWTVEYAPIGQRGAEEWHANHELNLIGVWTAVGAAGAPTEGSLVGWVQHALTWGDVTTSDLMQSGGVISPLNGGDTSPDRSHNLLQLLAWEQIFANRSLRVGVGKITTRVTFDLNRYAVSDREDFFSPMIVNTPVVLYTARSALGVFGQVTRSGWYLSGMVRDADASDPFIDFESLGSGRWEYLAEVGFTPTFGGLGSGNYRFTYYYTDPVGDGTSAIPSGWSWAFSFDQDLGPRVGAFLRYAHADTPVRTFASRWAGGFQLKRPFGYEDDRVGLGGWWGDPTDTSLRAEVGTELFYRAQITRAGDLTPHVQLVFNPALDPGRSFLPVFGLRMRLHL